MKNFIQIRIEKNKTDSVFFLHGYTKTLLEIVEELRSLNPEIVHVTTREQERVLIEAYISFLDEKLFMKRLLAASKAQI